MIMVCNYSSSFSFSSSILLMMDVLRPVLININGRIYRKNPIQEEDYEEEEDYSYSETGLRFWVLVNFIIIHVHII